MGILDSIQASFKRSFDKKRESREMMERLQAEAKASGLVVFKEEFRKNALEVEKAKAKKEAATLSGLRKLRAMNRARRLTEPSNSFMSKFSGFTQANIARREENIKRTTELREAAKKMREDDKVKREQGRATNIARSSGFGKSTWRM